MSLETQYDLQYIGVQISDNLKQEILQSLQQKRKSLHNKVYQTKKKIVDPTSIFRQNQKCYLHNADRILSDGKQYYVIDKIREKCKTYYAENIESIRKKDQVYKSNNVNIIKHRRAGEARGPFFFYFYHLLQFKSIQAFICNFACEMATTHF